MFSTTLIRYVNKRMRSDQCTFNSMYSILQLLLQFLYNIINLVLGNGHRQLDRYFIVIKKSHYILIFHRNERYVCTCIYTLVNLLNV